MLQDFSAQIVISMIGAKPKMFVRLDSVVAGILKFIREQLIHKPDAAPFLKLVDQKAGAGPANRFQREGQLIAAVTATGVENVAGQALRVNTNQRRVLAAYGSHHQRQGILRLIRGLESKEREDTESGGETGFGDFPGFHSSAIIAWEWSVWQDDVVRRTT